MVYVGMAVSSKSFVVHAVNERKRVVWRGEVAATPSGLKRAMAALGSTRSWWCSRRATR